MLEKEVASIIKFILDSAGNPVPYYHNMPENFVVPSVYFRLRKSLLNPILSVHMERITIYL